MPSLLFTNNFFGFFVLICNQMNSLKHKHYSHYVLAFKFSEKESKRVFDYEGISVSPSVQVIVYLTKIKSFSI
jgi:hypothetical protein